jgi:hypothetical protein
VPRAGGQVSCSLADALDKSEGVVKRYFSPAVLEHRGFARKVDGQAHWETRVWSFTGGTHRSTNSSFHVPPSRQRAQRFGNRLKSHHPHRIPSLRWYQRHEPGCWLPCRLKVTKVQLPNLYLRNLDKSLHCANLGAWTASGDRRMHVLTRLRARCCAREPETQSGIRRFVATLFPAVL